MGEIADGTKYNELTFISQDNNLGIVLLFAVPPNVIIRIPVPAAATRVRSQAL
jgi:hypothetical protein